MATERPFTTAVDVFAAAYAEALAAGTQITADELVQMARQSAGRVAAPEAVAAAARVAAELSIGATTLAATATESAAADALAAIQDWADLQRATEVLASSIAAAMSRPGMTPEDRSTVKAKAGDIAAALGRGATENAARAALEKAIVSRAIADASADIVAGAAVDAHDVVVEIARTAARIHDTAVTASALLSAARPRRDSEAAGD